jgi:hypothetical protein
MKQLETELLGYFSNFNYITKDEDGTITFFYNKPTKSKSFWNSIGDFQTLEGFQFSKFIDKKWEDCLISIGEDELINLRYRRNDLLGKKYKIEDIISSNYFNDSEFNLPIIELEKVKEQIEEAIKKLDSEINKSIQNKL